ncbi:MAG: hypothetical protein ABI844_16490, partial [Saprospiraceae bacterium]
IIMLSIYFTGCYYDNVPDLYPGACNTENITYSTFVRPFIDAGCTCHVKGSKNGNVSLNTYTELQSYITNGQFMGSIKHESGLVPMPPSAPKKTDCQISKLESWIMNGALEN